LSVKRPLEQSVQALIPSFKSRISRKSSWKTSLFHSNQLCRSPYQKNCFP